MWNCFPSSIFPHHRICLALKVGCTSFLEASNEFFLLTFDLLSFIVNIIVFYFSIKNKILESTTMSLTYQIEDLLVTKVSNSYCVKYLKDKDYIVIYLLRKEPV